MPSGDSSGMLKKKWSSPTSKMDTSFHGMPCTGHRSLRTHTQIHTHAHLGSRPHTCVHSCRAQQLLWSDWYASQPPYVIHLWMPTSLEPTWRSRVCVASSWNLLSMNSKCLTTQAWLAQALNFSIAILWFLSTIASTFLRRFLYVLFIPLCTTTAESQSLASWHCQSSHRKKTFIFVARNRNR